VGSRETGLMGGALEMRSFLNNKGLLLEEV
jgi:hypothetical protein